MICEHCKLDVKMWISLHGTDFNFCSHECLDAKVNSLSHSELKKISDLAKLELFTPMNVAH